MRASTSFSKMNVSKEPYLHGQMSQFFDANTAVALSGWLENCDLWVKSSSDVHFFEHFRILPSNTPPQLHDLFFGKGFQEIFELVRKQIGPNVSDKIDIIALKQWSLTKVNVHNDFGNYSDGFRALRLNIYLSPNLEEDCGGHFQMHLENGEIVKNIAPLFNTALAFEISPLSYHSVSRISEKNRYCLSYTFWKD